MHRGPSRTVKVAPRVAKLRGTSARIPVVCYGEKGAKGEVISGLSSEERNEEKRSNAHQKMMMRRPMI